MRRKYTKQEILALISLSKKYGDIKYVNPFDIENEFKSMTGIERKSGPLYMTAWRIKQGKYNNLLAN